MTVSTVVSLPFTPPTHNKYFTAFKIVNSLIAYTDHTPISEFLFPEISIYIYSLSLPKGKSAVVSTDLGVALTHTSTAGGPWLAVVICAV